MSSGDREAFIRGLHELTKFLETHPAVAVPNCITLNVFLDTKEQITAQARLASWEKIHNDTWFYLRRSFSGNIDFDVTVDRQIVCRKIVRGVKEIPAQPARTAEIVDWVCEESLLEPARG